MEQHQRHGGCDKSYLLDGKLVECPLGCGEQVTFYEQVRHLSLFCANRLVQCPNTQYCKESMPFRMLAGHQVTCPARVIPCGQASTECARTLRSWVETGITRNTPSRLVACDLHRSTGMSWAVLYHEVDVVHHLITLTGGDQTGIEDIWGNTPFTLACSLGHLDLVWLMLEHGGRVNVETSSGKTPLIEAVKGGHIEVVKLLVKHGAILDYVPRHRKTAFDYADVAEQDVSLFIITHTYTRKPPGA